MDPDAHSTELIDVPQPSGIVGLKALRGILRRRSIIGALEVMHAEMGDVFRIAMPGFNPVILVGPEASRFILVTERDEFRWRVENEPITLLLGRGILVQDGEAHDRIRQRMNPPLHKQMLARYVHSMWHCTDQVTATWLAGETLDMLEEMRKVALLILADTLFGVNFSPELERLWDGVIRAVRYISPGPWVLWRGLSHLGYNRKLRMIDDYLYRIIRERRQQPNGGDDLLSVLVHNTTINDDLIRDQLMTMLIAGHDTTTANLAWTLYLLGAHPEALTRAQDEVRQVLSDAPPSYERLNDLKYLAAVIDESLRLYPPIHLGSRVAAVDLEFQGYRIPAGTRVLYSIYLTQRHPDHWERPNRFEPERFLSAARPAPYTYLPFGGGPRNCIGAAFAQVEAKVVLARILQRCDMAWQAHRVRPFMGATLEPRSGVRMRIKRRPTT